MKQLEMWPRTRSELGRAGYLVTIARMGKEEFHRAGGLATAKLDYWHCCCHGTGVNAYSFHNKLKGKRHRYGKRF